MGEDKYLRKGRDVEEEADKLEKSVDNFHEKAEKYIDAGEYYEQAQQLSKAVLVYEQARKYADADQQEIINEKLQALSRQKRKMGSILRGTSPLFEQKYQRRFIFVILSVITLLSALFFTSVSLTGYSVFELTQNNSRFIGTIFFIVGLVFVFLYFRRNNLSHGKL